MDQKFAIYVRPSRSSLVLPVVVVFAVSFCIMVLELTAARLVAKQLGSSLYTWTAVIGMVLIGITMGNWIGGRVADRFSPAAAMSVLLVISSAACIAVAILNNLVGDWLWLWKLTWPARVFSHVAIIFVPPSLMMGLISPVAAKMALERGLPRGRTVGIIYAWGAAGSIVGTFVAGYWLIAAMGPETVIWILGGILLLAGVFCSERLWPFVILAGLFLSAMMLALGNQPFCRTWGATMALRTKPDPSVLYKEETPYCSVSVKRLTRYPDKRVFIQDKLTHSEIVMGDIDDLQYFYTKIYAAITHGVAEPGARLSFMVIGGGGYVFPRYLEKHWPDSSIEVVEIDPGVTRAATQAFGLSPDTSIITRTMDARNYVEQLLLSRSTSDRTIKYDLIYGDAVNDFSAPYQLLTRQFNDELASLLTDRGVYMLTVIDIYKEGGYLGAIVNTLKQTFPDVYVMADARMPDWARNTFVVVASKRELNLKAIVAANASDLNLHSLNDKGMEYLQKKSHGIILTDDYAPVENLLAPVVRQSAKGFLAHKYMTDAEACARADKPDRAVQLYEKAAAVKAELTNDAWGQIGLIRVEQGKFEDAVTAFKKAISYDRQNEMRQNLAKLHFEFGNALEGLSRFNEAAEQYRLAANDYHSQVERHPDTAELHFRFGKALVKAADMETASKAFRRAVDLEPDNVIYCIELAKTLEFLGRYDRAHDALMAALTRIEPEKRPDDVATLKAYIDVIDVRKREAADSHTDPNSPR